MLTFEQLVNLHLGFSKVLKGCVEFYLSSNVQVTRGNGSKLKSRPLSCTSRTIFCICNEILRLIVSDFEMPRLKVPLSNGDKLCDLHCLFTNTGVRGMLGGKNTKVQIRRGVCICCEVYRQRNWTC